jgi:hypothetical protein
MASDALGMYAVQNRHAQCLEGNVVQSRDPSTGGASVPASNTVWEVSIDNLNSGTSSSWESTVLRIRHNTQPKHHQYPHLISIF